MKFLLSLSFIVFSFVSHAQKVNSEATSTGEIFGQILDSASSVGLEFAAISLYQKDSDKIITGGMSSESGKFDLTEVPFGAYYIAIQFVGYPKKIINNILLTKEKPVINLGKIELVGDNLLNEVVVDGSTPTIMYDIDKKVIDVSNLEVTTGQTAVQILENSPSVMVQNDGTVLLRGSSSFTLFINGRPTAMEPSDALATIPASTIKNIEIITNPSAKYEAEGASGIMNIITKSNKLEGMSMLANVTGGNYNNYSGDVSLNVSHEKTTFNVGIDYRNRSNPKDEFTERLSKFDSGTTTIRSNGLTDWGAETYGANAEFVWTPNTAHTFTIGSRINKRNMKSVNELQFDELIDDANVNSYFNDGLSQYSITSNSSYLTYRYNIKRKQDHYIEGRAVYNYRFGDDVVLIDYLDADGKKTGGTKNTEVGPSNMIRFNLDYSSTYKNDMKFEAGTQIQFGESTDENQNFEYNPITGEYELQALFSASANYIRNIAGFYGLVQGKKGKLGYQFGLRTEYTDRSITAELQDKTTHINRWDWFPTIHFSYTLPKENQLLINYTRRIQRPRSYFLEPFFTWRNAYSIYSGNPDLSPEYIDAFEVNWIKSFAKKGFVSVETYIRLVDNYIDRVQMPFDTNITLTSPLNVGKTVSVGVEPSFSYKLFSWWKTDIAFNLFQYAIKSGHEQINSSNNFNWNSRFTNTFPIKGNWNVQLASRYIGPANTVQGEVEGYFTMNGSVRKSFNNNKYSLIFQVQDIFSTIKNESRIQAGNVYTYQLSEPRTPLFTFTFSMRLNNYVKKEKAQESDDF